MKKVPGSLAALILAFALLLSFGCSGSKTYRGKWKAMDKDGQKFDLSFDANSFTIKDAAGTVSRYDYTQNSVSIENSVSTYGIKLKDGRGYQVNFPNSHNESVGLIKDENGNLVYTIGRTAYLKYDDIYKLK